MVKMVKIITLKKVQEYGYIKDEVIYIYNISHLILTILTKLRYLIEMQQVALVKIWLGWLR